jgi:hypothetical protein
VIETLADHLNARGLLQFGAMPARAWEPPLLVADMKKLDALGLRVCTPMAEALDESMKANT